MAEKPTFVPKTDRRRSQRFVMDGQEATLTITSGPTGSASMVNPDCDPGPKAICTKCRRPVGTKPHKCRHGRLCDKCTLPH